MIVPLIVRSTPDIACARRPRAMRFRARRLFFFHAPLVTLPTALPRHSVDAAMDAPSVGADDSSSDDSSSVGADDSSSAEASPTPMK